MIITLNTSTTEKELEALINTITNYNLKVNVHNSDNLRLLEVQGDVNLIDIKLIEVFECVSKIQVISVPFKKASREYHKEDTIIEIGDVKIGGNNPICIMAGP